MTNQQEILAFDNSQLEKESDSTAYYRIDPHFRNFLVRCMEKYGIIGITYQKGKLNMGFILGEEEETKEEEE